jgi:hypothetical protein
MLAVLNLLARDDVDGRDKPGHDDKGGGPEDAA